LPPLLRCRITAAGSSLCRVENDRATHAVVACRAVAYACAMRILGIDAGNKEATVALVVDGRLVLASAEERHSRRRFDQSMPLRALRRVLGDANLTLDDIDAVAGNVSERRLRSALGLSPRNTAPFPRVDGGPESHGLHHLSHAALTFLTSGFAEALVVTVDNHGDNDTLVVFRASAAGFERLGSVAWQPVPIGGVYEEATGLLGFGEGGEGKLMGLAGYGRVDSHRAARFLQRTGRWTVHSAFLSDMHDPLWREGRAPWAAIERPRHANLAADVQASLETTVLAFIADAIVETGLRDICLAGGVALNCSLNGAVARMPEAERVWVSMSPGDPGNAAGAALLWAMRAGEPVGRAVLDGGLGPRTSAETIHEAVAQLQDAEIDSVGAGDSAEVAARAAQDIAEGMVIGWFEGGAEFGPRALGHRSILGDPRHAAITDRINDTKLRQHWRPVAPSILAEHAAGWLHEPQHSPFMLMAFTATEKTRNEAPAAVHIDGTTRAQTVHGEQRAYHRLLSAFEQQTGLPLVLNTSFNQAGEPIVETPADAIDCARRAGLDAVWIDGLRVRFKTAFRPVDTRAKRIPALVSGDVSDGWVAALCRQNRLAVRGHIGPGSPTELAMGVLGLGDVLSGLPILATGAAADQARIGPENRDVDVYLHGPTSARDAVEFPPNARACSMWLALGSVATCRTHIAEQRIGSVQSVEVVMPQAVGPLDDPGLATSRWRLAWDRLAQGLAIVRLLTACPQSRVWLTGDSLRDLVLSTRGDDWNAEIRVAGPGPIPAISVDGAKGSVELNSGGRISLAIDRDDGACSVRREDTERGPNAFFDAIAAHIEDGQSWPHAPDLLHGCGTDVDEALVRWGRSTFGGAGAWSLAERQKHADGATRNEESPGAESQMPGPSDELPSRLLAGGLVATLAYRPFAVAAGFRRVASYENANASGAAVIDTIARDLGLHTHRGPDYRCAVTQRGGAGDRFTLFVAADPDLAAQADKLTARLSEASQGAQQRQVQHELGALFGYPTCCIAAWHRWQSMNLDAAFTIPIAAGTTGAFNGYCNVRPPARIADHLPCSFSCARTAADARKVVTYVAENATEVLRVLRPHAAGAAIPGLSETALNRVLTAPPGDIHDELTRTLFAPLLYIDTTRYAVFDQGRAVRGADPGTWLVHGRPVASGPLIGAMQTPEEAVIQRDLLQRIVAPLARHATGGVTFRSVNGSTVIADAEGNRLVGPGAQTPAGEASTLGRQASLPMILLPFGRPA